MGKKGFTLVEFTVVMVCIAILVVVTAPFMMGRIDAARWTEGKTAMGTIATALHAYCIEQSADLSAPPLISSLGFTSGDLGGTYFNIDNYLIESLNFKCDGSIFDYSIVARHGGLTPVRYTLDQSGNWEP